MFRILFLLFALFKISAPFVTPNSNRFLQRNVVSIDEKVPPLCLHKLTGNDLPPMEYMPDAAKQWDFHLLETTDLPAASTLALDSFYKPRLKLDTTNMTGPEKWIFGGMMKMYSDADKSDTYNGNYLGFRSRSARRLDKPSFDLSSYSFILAATSSVHTTTNDGNPELAAVVEICLERPSGKLAPPIQNPFRSHEVKSDEQPYLCNLCVAPTSRRKGLGRLICDLCEELVQIHWNKNIMYLHVEQDNMAAQALYLGMGYTLVSPGLSAREKKMEGIENILYYSKPLKRQWDGKSNTNGLRTSVQLEEDRDGKMLGMNALDMQVASNIMKASSDR